jgi:hypothetical protein
MSDIPSASTPSSAPASGDGTIERLRDEANRKATEFEREGERETEGLRRRLKSAARDFGDETSSVAHDLKNRARGYVEERKTGGADRLASFAHAAERAADDLEKESPEAARYVREAASGVERFSSRLRERSVEDWAADARDFARRQPFLVFGGAVLAGLAISRFLKSSAEDRPRPNSSFRQDSDSRSYGGSNDYE